MGWVARESLGGRGGGGWAGGRGSLGGRVGLEAVEKLLGRSAKKMAAVVGGVPKCWQAFVTA